MIIQTTKEINGVVYAYTYSDSGFMIERDGAEYAEAVDVTDAPYTYTETETKIPEDGAPEDADALRARLADAETAAKILLGEAE